MVLNALLVQDRMIRLNLDILEGLLREIKADVEELNLLAESCLDEEELKLYRNVMLKAEAELLAKLGEVIDHVYDIYEVFNFDATFLATIPEELRREIERLDAVNAINSRLELLSTLIEEMLLVGENSYKLQTLMAPFKVYKEVLRHSIEFNKRLQELTFQRTG